MSQRGRSRAEDLMDKLEALQENIFPSCIDQYARNRDVLRAIEGALVDAFEAGSHADAVERQRLLVEATTRSPLNVAFGIQIRRGSADTVVLAKIRRIAEVYVTDPEQP